MRFKLILRLQLNQTLTLTPAVPVVSKPVIWYKCPACTGCSPRDAVVMKSISKFGPPNAAEVIWLTSGILYSAKTFPALQTKRYSNNFNKSTEIFDIKRLKLGSFSYIGSISITLCPPNVVINNVPLTSLVIPSKT